MENLINTNLNVNVKNKLVNAANSNRTMMFGIGMIVVVAIVVVLLVVVFRTRAVNQAMNPILIDQPINAYDVAENSQQFDVQPSERGLEYTYSCWFYVQDWYYRFNDWKAIFVKGPTSGDPVANGGMNPGVYLYPETNNLLVSIATYNNPKEQVSVSNIPLQKWVHLTVVLNNRTVDVYVNGKLERSKVLAGVPKLNADKVSVAPDQGFFGKISRLQYFARSLKPDEVYSVYQNGPY